MPIFPYKSLAHDITVSNHACTYFLCRKIHTCAIDILTKFFPSKTSWVRIFVNFMKYTFLSKNRDQNIETSKNCEKGTLTFAAFVSKCGLTHTFFLTSPKNFRVSLTFQTCPPSELRAVLSSSERKKNPFSFSIQGERRSQGTHINGCVSVLLLDETFKA